MNFDNGKLAINLLPKDGIAHYYEPVFDVRDKALYFDALLKTVDWQNDEIVIFGKKIITKRKVAWYGDERFSYTYSKSTKLALPWTREMRALKQKAEEISGEQYNSCLLNLYRNGDEGMSWHSDNENSLVEQACIASISLGACRKFAFKHKHSKQRIDLMLEAGSLLLMKEKTQQCWWHSLPKSKKVVEPRINLTFRRMKITTAVL